MTTLGRPTPTLRLAPTVAEALKTEGLRVVVIGPTGWIGSATLAMLDAALPEPFVDIAKQVLVFGSRERALTLPSGRTLTSRPLSALIEHDLADALILHLGYLTRDKTQAIDADNYLAANEAIQATVIAAVRTGRPLGIFFASSGGVYQRLVEGRPDRDSNPYGWLKLRHEEELAAAAREAGVCCINGRIFTLAGEYINKLDLYALGSVLSALRDGRPIVIQAAKQVWRSYAYVGDVVNAALFGLQRGRSLTLDIAGSEPIEIGDLALRCREIVGSDVPIQRPGLSHAEADRMIGDPSHYTALLGEADLTALALEAQIAATAAFLGMRC